MVNQSQIATGSVVSSILRSAHLHFRVYIAFPKRRFSLFRKRSLSSIEKKWQYCQKISVELPFFAKKRIFTEKKWQYCQKIFVKREFKEPFGFLVLSDSRTLLPHFMVTRFVSFLFSFENSLLKICLSSKECLFLHMK